MKRANKLRLVLDTNVFLVSLLPHHKYWWIFEGIQNQLFDVLVSNEILLEYLEVCCSKYGLDRSEETLDFLLEFPNVELITPSFKWNLIRDDPDDDKFVDCAIAGGADFIVTHDKHFNVLQSINFPIVRILRVEELKQILVT